jgi:hypothetical protein
MHEFLGIIQHPPLVVSRTLSRSLDAVQQQEVTGEEARKALGNLLHAALRLEFAVIPVYLSAGFSLKPGNGAIAQLLLRAAIEEMLHFTVVANTLNAIGIAPDVKGAVPTFPCDVDVIEPPLRMELKSFSPDLVRDLFLRIETPEDPIEFEAPFIERPRTVGQFYQGIIDIFEADTMPGLFDVDPTNLNVPVIPDPPRFRPTAYRDDNDEGKYPIPASIDFRITDRASVVRHLKWIVDQGEGTSRTDTNPIDISGLPAHYYRFVSILKGRYLVADEEAEKEFSYSGGSLRFDPADVHECDPNPKAADYAEHDRVFRHMNRFNRTYSDMIEALAIAFGSRDEIAARAAYDLAIPLMGNMDDIALAIYREAGRAGVKAGVPFEYQQA